MSDDFDQVFGARRPNFAERVAGDGKARPPAAVPTASPDGDYKPFGFLPTGIGESCEILRWADGTDVPEGIEFQYRFLMQIGFVGEEELRLMLPETIVVIEGQNLRELRRKLARRQATFVQQYSKLVWPKAPAKGEPLVSRIQFVRPNDANGKNN